MPLDSDSTGHVGRPTTCVQHLWVVRVGDAMNGFHSIAIEDKVSWLIPRGKSNARAPNGYQTPPLPAIGGCLGFVPNGSRCCCSCLRFTGQKFTASIAITPSARVGISTSRASLHILFFTGFTYLGQSGFQTSISFLLSFGAENLQERKLCPDE